ncbi:MAG TPA: phosphatase PAP2 family protein [Pseudolabrys sp.]|jgi:undecaprenyl-diphosphatase|nr:phosphatase PAP2 family protein [Pseudolabrys sp.]
MSGLASLPGDADHPNLIRRTLANLEDTFALLVRTPRGSVSRRLPWRRNGVVIAVAVSATVFALVLVLADGPTIRAVREVPSSMLWPFFQITRFGKSGWFLWPLGIAFLLLAAVPSRLPRQFRLVRAMLAVRIGFLFAAIAVPGLAAAILKGMIGRARPFVGGVADPFLFHPFNFHAAYESLPSGHTTTAFSALVAIGSVWPQARPVMWIYALLIALSRIMVLAHHPSDVFAGAVVGAAGALIVRHYFAERRLGFSLTTDGRTRCLPGPSWRRIKAVARALFS